MIDGMNKAFAKILMDWPLAMISDKDLQILLPGSVNSRHSLTKRCFQEQTLVPLKKGLYIIGKPYHQGLPDLFELAQWVYGPSYVSLASALSYHQLIPEAVYTVTSVSAKRTCVFESKLGCFHFAHTPKNSFYLGVNRIKTPTSVFLMASPWKALADYIYVYKKTWNSMLAISEDLRIDMENLQSKESLQLLNLLSVEYPSKAVRIALSNILKNKES